MDCHQPGTNIILCHMFLINTYRIKTNYQYIVVCLYLAHVAMNLKYIFWHSKDNYKFILYYTVQVICAPLSMNCAFWNDERMFLENKWPPCYIFTIEQHRRTSGYVNTQKMSNKQENHVNKKYFCHVKENLWIPPTQFSNSLHTLH